MSLKKIKIKQKLLLIPIITFLFSAILFIIVYMGLSNQKKAIDNIFNVRFKSFEESSNIVESILDIHSSLNQMINWASSNYKVSKIKKLGEEIREKIKKMNTDINKNLNSNRLNTKQKELYQLTLNQLEDYKNSAFKVIKMVSLDISSANMFMVIAYDKLHQLQKTIDELQIEEIKLSKKSYDFSIKNYNFITKSIIFIFAILISLVLIISFILTASILIPLKHLKTILNDIAKGEGDLTKQIENKSKDEIGELGNIFNSFVNKLKNIILHIKASSNKSNEIGKNLAEIAIAVSTGNEKISSTIESNKKSINLLNQEIHDSVSAVAQISQTINNIVISINNQSNSVEMSSTSIEEMAATINNTTRVMVEKKNLSNKLSTIAQAGYEKMTQSIKAMTRISDSTNNMFQMINVVNDIAQRTKLLAMNAAIEAVHAGEKGKGFTVIAEEIRKLSDQTANNAKSINETLKNTVDDIYNSNELNKLAGETFFNIVNGIKDVVNAMEEMSKSMEELATGSNEIVNGTISLNNITQEIKTGATEINESVGLIDKNILKVSDISSQTLKGIEEISKMALQISQSMTELTEIGKINEINILEVDNELNQFKT